MAPLRPLPRKRVHTVAHTSNAISPDSRVWQILNSKPTTFLHQNNGLILYHTYKDDLRRGDMLMGIDPRVTESIIEKVDVAPFVGRVQKVKVEAPDILTKAVVDMKVKNNKVGVSISCPIESLYMKYHSKGIKPPLKERILAYSRIGYSDQKLAKMIKFDDEQNKKMAEYEAFITAIFGDLNKKKTSTAPKKKTLLQMIGYRKPKYATNEDFVEGGM